MKLRDSKTTQNARCGMSVRKESHQKLQRRRPVYLVWSGISYKDAALCTRPTNAECNQPGTHTP